MLEKINNAVFLYFCKNVHTSVHIRELARKINISPPKCIGLINKLGSLLKKNKVGRSILISANINEDFIFIKKWVNLFLLLDSGLVGALSKANPKSLIVFGSFSRGEDNEKSDIDIAVDTPITENLDKYERFIGRRIKIHVVNDRTGNSLLENARQGILLKGVMVRSHL